MGITDIVVILIILVIVGGASLYIVKKKKEGVKCIGCPHAGSCSKCTCSEKKA